MGRLVDVSLGPLIEPVTVDEAKRHARVSIPDDDEDIAALISSARGIVESMTSRALILQTIRLTLDGFPFGGGYFSRSARMAPTLSNFLPSTGGEIPLARPPFLGLDSIEYIDPAGISRSLDLGNVRVLSASKSCARIVPAINRPWPVTYAGPGAVVIQYRAGYGGLPATVPPVFKTAIKMLVSHWYNNRDAAAEANLTEIPFSVSALLASEEWGAYR